MKVGIVGTGTMGDVHASAWQAVGADLVGCTSVNPDQSEALARRYGIRSFADYVALLDNVDIIDVCTPTPQHKPMVLAAAEVGKHVVCEKPIALTVEDGEAMIDACGEVRLFVGMALRFFPQYRSARDLVAAGQIGQPAVLRLKRVSYVPQRAPDAWYFDDRLSGGIAVDLMIHDFDYARWLAGEVERVYAARTRSATSLAQYVQATLRLRNGAIALVEGGWAYPPGVFRTAFDLSGTDGLIEWSSDQPEPLFSLLPPKPGETASVGLPMSGLAEDPFTAEIRHAYRCIQSNAPFEVTAEDALEALRISLAVKTSLDTGKPVTLERPRPRGPSRPSGH